MQRVKVLLFLFIFLNGNTPIKAATFYISSSSGNDNETAARAQNENSPWKSIDKLNSIMNSLSPGDKVLFKRGDVFYGTIKINRHNNSNNAIEFGAYGTGDKPIITSFVEVNGWSSVGNGVYEAELRITEIEKINVFTIDETPYELGRFPNFDGPNKGYLNIESTPNNNSIISSNLSGSSNWSGGEIVIRKNPWIIDRHNISSHSSTRINYSTNSSHYNANKGYGFFIQNHLNTLDQFGEWYYDKNNQKLYVYFGDRSPANHTVKISNLPYLISFGWDIGNITINDLDLRGANTTGIRIQQGTNVKILNTNISLTGENAILGILSHDLEISNCSINHSLNNGIQIQNSTRNVKILNNEIKNTHVFNGMGMSADLNGQAIYTTNDSHNGLIENNRIYNTGYIAINFGGNNTVVKNNFIDNFCMHKSDGGGIYTWEGPDNKNMSGRVVEGNIIVNGVGYKEGTLYNGTISPTPIEGIYLDDNSSGIEIKNNTVSNVSNNGVYFHNARNILYENNLSYSCQQHVLLSHDEYGDPIRNIKIENNIFFTPNPNEKFLKVFSIKDDFEYMGNFHNNYYINPFGNDFGFINEFLHPNLNIDSKLMNLSWWGRDSSGHLTPKEHPYLEVLERSENNLFRNKDFTENVQHTFCNGNCDRTWSNNEFFQGGHVVVNTKVKSKFTLETGSLKENKYYLLKFTAKSNKEGYISLEFNENVDPWRFLTETRGFNISKDIQEYEFIFYNNIETRSSFITLKSELNDFSYGLDEVELLEIEVDQFNAEDFLFFEYNNTPSPQRFPLSGSYLDAKNNSFTSAIEIPPFSSAALIRLSTEKTQEHEPPIIQFISPSTDRQLFVGEKLKIEIEAESKYSEINIIEVYVDEILIKSFKNTPEIFEQVFEEEGDFILKAKAIDINGMEAFSESLNISVSHSEIAPTISWLSPSDNDFFFESDPIKLEVSVDSDEQNIENVEFSINNNVVGFSNTLPYQISLPNLPLGSHNLKAIAKSSNGLFGETEIITINVVAAANIPPSIIISSPSNNSTFTFGDVISINTEAQDTDGTITQVEFFNGTSHIGILSSEPFTFVWDNAPLGNHSITARATDDKGAVAISSPINIQVNEKTNIAPTINITSPSNNSTFTFGDVISINAEALDADRTITQVEFFNGTSHIGTLSSEPFTFVWGNAPLGNHSITARATDDKGAVAISSPINIQVNEKTNIAPTINITSPSNNSTFTFGDVISINAEAQDADGTITQVEFFNGTSHIGTLSSEPFTFVWGNAPLGNHSIIARATDDKGAVAISSPINIQVNEKTNIAPTINITSPSNNSTFTFGDVISINAEAQDADGTITQVEFFNGTSHIGTLSSEPFTFVWDNAPLGNHSITARATDDKGAVENSSSVNIQIIEKEKNPSFKIISPEEKINYYRDDQLLLNVEISEESSEIVKVEYFRNNIFIGSRNDGNYAYNWRISIIGDINITAIATDVNGKTASDARSIQVTERPKETLFVEITSPSNNSTFIYGENIVINADVLDPTDNETRVEFFQNNILIGESHEFPYQVVWINPPLGKHTLIARVSNNRGNNSYSNPVSINVVQDESIPEIELISPISDQIFDFDENVDLMVMFNGDTKNVKRIEYYAGNKLIASAEEYPYFSKWEKTNPGDHMIFAKIIGNDPNKYKQSNSNKITIKNELDESVFRIISPTTLSEHSIGTDLEIKVQIPNSNKPIEKVEYYRGNTLIGSSNIFPYNFIWENAPLGEVTLISRLVYSDGSILISLPIRIHIKEVPQIILKIEQGKHEFVSSENITFKPEFLHFIHEIALVEIFVNGSSINKIESQPFSFDLTNLAFGIHEIWIEALDKNGNRYISEIIEITIKETSFEEYLELTDFKFGPNPTVRYLNLFFGNIAEEFNVKASIFSLNGNLVKSYEFLMNSNEVTLDLENLISGTYLLRIQFNGNLIASKRFVKHY